MSHAPESTSPDSPSSASLSLTLARIGAVVLAIGVVAYLVYDAQSTANPSSTTQPDRPAQSVVGDPDEVLLPSSKSLVIEPALMGSKSGVLPSTKGMVLDPEALRAPAEKSPLVEPMLFGSKSGPPVIPPTVSPSSQAAAETGAAKNKKK